MRQEKERFPRFFQTIRSREGELLDIMQMPLEERVKTELKHTPFLHESPTFAQMRALVHMLNEEKIPEEVIESVIGAAERYRPTLFYAMDYWNKIVEAAEVRNESVRNESVENGLVIVSFLICNSYGSHDLSMIETRRVMLNASARTHYLLQRSLLLEA